MKYALISDIHGNFPALEAVIRDSIANNVDYFIFLGDYCIGLAYPNEVIDCIRKMDFSYAVSSNEDELFVNYATMNPANNSKGQYEAGTWIYIKYASDMNDYIRNFCAKTWYSAYEAWEALDRI